MLPLLITASRIALNTNTDRRKHFCLGAIGIRRDGAMVAAKNGAVISSAHEDYQIIGEAHAESRVIRKLGKQGIIYVARVLKRDGSLAMARPCGGCQLRINAAQVKKVYYTINDCQYGILDVTTQTDRVYTV